jgi:hypothetical protein
MSKLLRPSRVAPHPRPEPWPGTDPAVVADGELAHHVIDGLHRRPPRHLAPVPGPGLLPVHQGERVVGVTHGVQVTEPDGDLVDEPELLEARSRRRRSPAAAPPSVLLNRSSGVKCSFFRAACPGQDPVLPPRQAPGAPARCRSRRAAPGWPRSRTCSVLSLSQPGSPQPAASGGPRPLEQRGMQPGRPRHYTMHVRVRSVVAQRPAPQVRDPAAGLLHDQPPRRHVPLALRAAAHEPVPPPRATPPACRRCCPGDGSASRCERGELLPPISLRDASSAGVDPPPARPPAAAGPPTAAPAQCRARYAPPPRSPSRRPGTPGCRPRPPPPPRPPPAPPTRRTHGTLDEGPGPVQGVHDPDPSLDQAVRTVHRLLGEPAVVGARPGAAISRVRQDPRPPPDPAPVTGPWPGPPSAAPPAPSGTSP